MINTAVFESFERYNRLNNAIIAIMSVILEPHPYDWMMPYLIEAMEREKNFMLSNKEDWEDRLK